MITVPRRAPPPRELEGGERRRRRRWPWVVGSGFVVLMLIAFGILVRFAAGYQPLRFGGMSGSHYQGLPVGHGIRDVNTFLGQTGQEYVPLQGGAFSILTSLSNNGPYSVTVLAVSVQGASEGFHWPLTPAGAVRYRPLYEPETLKAGTLAKPFSLAPQQYVVIGIPVRFSDFCTEPGAWTSLDHYWVEERFLSFSKWVPISIGQTILMNEPLARSAGGTHCVR